MVKDIHKDDELILQELGILTEAIPFMRHYAGRVVVVKVLERTKP